MSRDGVRPQDGLPHGPAPRSGSESHVPQTSPQTHENSGQGLLRGRQTFSCGSHGPGMHRHGDLPR